jgi:hypothetical protein
MMKILPKTSGQRDSWQQKTRIGRYLLRSHDSLDTPVDVLRPSDPLDNLVSWQGGG